MPGDQFLSFSGSISTVSSVKTSTYGSIMEELNILNNISSNKKYKSYLNNYLCSFLPDKYKDVDEVRKVSAFFINMWEELSL